MTLFNYLRVNPDTPTPLAVQLSQQLARLIASGDVPAGEKLPSVRKLADHLGINLHTVRAAYRQLEDNGLVVTRQRSGTLVLPLEQRTQSAPGSKVLSFTIGILIPVHSPFYIPFLRGLEDEAAEGPWLLHTIDTYGFQRHVARTLEQLSARNVDGLIAIHYAGPPLQELSPSFDANRGSIPIVYADSPGMTGYGVGFDRSAASFEATMHLVEHGHRRIGLLTPPSNAAYREDTNRGFHLALEEANLPLDPDWIAIGARHTVEDGFDAVQQLLDMPEPPSAIFATGDTLAIGAMQAIKARGLRVPEDIAVVGNGGMDLAALVEPPLTTIHLPLYELGLAAMQILRRLIAGEPLQSEHTILETYLTVRASCGPHD